MNAVSVFSVDLRVAPAADLGDVGTRLVGRVDVVCAMAIGADRRLQLAGGGGLGMHAVERLGVVVGVALLAGLIQPSSELAAGGVIHGGMRIGGDRGVASAALDAQRAVHRCAQDVLGHGQRQHFATGEGHGQPGLAVAPQAVGLGLRRGRLGRPWVASGDGGGREEQKGRSRQQKGKEPGRIGFHG